MFEYKIIGAENINPNLLRSCGASFCTYWNKWIIYADGLYPVSKAKKFVTLANKLVALFPETNYMRIKRFVSENIDNA